MATKRIGSPRKSNMGKSKDYKANPQAQQEAKNQQYKRAGK
ncbi:hypothetical protein [Virgibacillus halodenitrificans]|nr:hypothetical protein [Virgibacillus halodenitrificans]